MKPQTLSLFYVHGTDDSWLAITVTWRSCQGDDFSHSNYQTILIILYGAEAGTFWESLQWLHNERDSISNHQSYDCLLNGLPMRRSKNISKLRVTDFCAGNPPMNSPHKRPVTREMFPFDDVIMYWVNAMAAACLAAHEARALIQYKDAILQI